MIRTKTRGKRVRKKAAVAVRLFFFSPARWNHSRRFPVRKSAHRSHFDRGGTQRVDAHSLVAESREQSARREAQRG